MRPQDAAIAAAAGADAIGMIFYPGAARHIGLERAREVLSALPAFVTPVGLFVNQSAEEIRGITTALGLRHVQLHGQEPPALVGELAPLIVIKSVAADAAHVASELDRWRSIPARPRPVNLAALVFETAGTGQPGGSGVANDFELLSALRARGQLEGLPAIIAAGGLTPANVGAVIRQLRPWAVDVSSGVESVRGEKSPQLIEQFVTAVAAADSQAHGAS